jgi:hypothetical protein
MTFTSNDERLRLALEEQDAEDLELKSVLCDGGITPQKKDEIIAGCMMRIRRAQIRQNHNSTLLADRQKILAFGQVATLGTVLAHMLWGQQLTAQAIITELAKLLLLKVP